MTDEKHRAARAAFRGEDESAEVEGHLRAAKPEKAARGEDESPEVEGHLKTRGPEKAARSEDDSPDEDSRF
jgi:hypothetical protein